MKWMAYILLLTMLIGLFGCAAEPVQEGPLETQTSEAAAQTADLLRSVQSQKAAGQPADEHFSACAADFAVRLLQNSYAEGETCVLSPYSILIALAMAGNGASGDTLAQMETVLGMPVSEWNAYLLALQQEAGTELLSANSLWMHADLEVKQNFLQSIADHYDAEVYSAAFTDETLQEMNAWIDAATKGRIQNALDRMNPNAMLYLINALSFDAQWAEQYYSNKVLDGVFHAPGGDQPAQLLCSEEKLYLEDDMATGFMKDYAGGQYSFVALLPKEGVELADYIVSLSGEGLQQTLATAQHTSVMAQMPKCELQSSFELKEILYAMGMADAFTEQANFAAMSDADLFISRIVHQTSLKVDENGTQAGAATIEEFSYKGISLKQKTVILDRPYVMGIYDKINGCFLFLGAVNEL